MLPRVAPPCYRAKSFEIRLLVSDDAHQINLTQLFFARGQRRRRNLDRIVKRALPARERLQHPARLLARPTAELRNRNRQRQPVNDFSRVSLEKSRIRTR